MLSHAALLDDCVHPRNEDDEPSGQFVLVRVLCIKLCSTTSDDQGYCLTEAINNEGKSIHDTHKSSFIYYYLLN